MTRYAFILSSGRTGTKFLAEFFQANFPDTLARHEPPPSYHLRLLSNARAAGRISAWVIAAALRASRPAIRRFSGEWYIESNPFLYGCVDILSQVAPSPIILHLVRDPRSYVTSAINHGGSTGFKAGLSKWIPYWFPPVGRVPGVRRPFDPIEMFAGEWALVNQFLDAHGRSAPGYHRLAFEQVFDPANSGLRQICEMLGLTYPGHAAPLSGQEKINVSRLSLIGGWSTWTRDQCAALDRICGGLMGQYGYGGEPEWQARLAGHS